MNFYLLRFPDPLTVYFGNQINSWNDSILSAIYSTLVQKGELFQNQTTNLNLDIQILNLHMSKT